MAGSFLMHSTLNFVSLCAMTEDKEDHIHMYWLIGDCLFGFPHKMQNLF